MTGRRESESLKVLGLTTSFSGKERKVGAYKRRKGGEKRGKKGFLIMGDSWFDKYVYQVVVPEKNVDTHISQILKSQPKVIISYPMKLSRWRMTSFRSLGCLVQIQAWIIVFMSLILSVRSKLKKHVKSFCIPSGKSIKCSNKGILLLSFQFLFVFQHWIYENN